MKNLFTILLLCVGALFNNLHAQFTGEEIFVLDLKVDGVTTTYFNSGCGFSAPTTWGGAITGDFCLPVVWGYTATDSIGCTALVGDYTGKLVMLRRGTCEFGAKGLNAQNANAAAYACANNVSATAGDDCNAPGMGIGAVGASVTIPSFMFSRVMVNAIDNALKAGKNPEICVRRLALHDPSAEFSYAVPLSQVDTVELISLQCINRTSATQTYNAKCVITDPTGVVTELTSSLDIDADADSFFAFDNYVPLPKIGKYKMVFTTDKTTALGDTVYRTFEVTPHTFSTDNFTKRGGAANNTSFIESRKYSAASLYKTGDQPFKAKYITFGINNAAATAIGNVDADVVNIYIHDADSNNDGVNDFGSGLTAFDDMTLMAFGTYPFSATTPVDSLINVELESLLTGDPFVTFEPNHFYYARIEYDGNAAASDIQLSFTVADDGNYLLFTNIGAITPIIIGNSSFTGGWSGANVITRLQDETFNPTTGIVSPAAPQLDKTKVLIAPNPTADWANVTLDLTGVNNAVQISLISIATGRTVEMKKMSNVKEGRFSFDTSNLASGNYVVLVKTSEEGTRAFQVAVCH